MDKIREEFEQWWKSEYGAPLSEFNELWCAEGGYCDEDLDRQWEAWLASRASIVVELPERQTPYASNYGEGAYLLPNNAGECLEYSEVVEILRSIGLSIKGE